METNQMNNATLIKCPCCGSTAQVRAGDPYVVEGGAWFEQKAVCGCGASFTASFPRVVTAYYDVFEGRKSNLPLSLLHKVRRITSKKRY